MDPVDLITHLVCDIWPGICNISTGLCEYALMVVAIEQGILDISLSPILASSSSAHSIRLQTRLLKDHKHPTLVGCDAAFGYMRLYGEHVRVGLNRYGVV